MVVPLMEVLALAGVFVHDFVPRRAVAHVAQDFPGRLAAARHRFQPQGPQEHLPQMPYRWLWTGLRVQDLLPTAANSLDGLALEREAGLKTPSAQDLRPTAV